MSFKLASPKGVALPRIVERPIASGFAELEGALVVVTAGAYVACGADPATIAAVTISDGGADTAGFNKTGRKEFPPLFMQAVNPKGQVFRALYIGTLPTTDGAVYGVVRDTDNKWKVDFTDTTNTRVRLVGRFTDAPESGNEVLVTFLDANIVDN